MFGFEFYFKFHLKDVCYWIDSRVRIKVFDLRITGFLDDGTVQQTTFRSLNLVHLSDLGKSNWVEFQSNSKLKNRKSSRVKIFEKFFEIWKKKSNSCFQKDEKLSFQRRKNIQFSTKINSFFINTEITKICQDCA